MCVEKAAPLPMQKMLAQAGAANHAHHNSGVSQERKKSKKKKGQIVRMRSVQLKISSSLVVCVSVRFRVPTAPCPPSWPPRLVDEAGILETSRILRFASSCAASCHQAARHFFATIVQRNVCRGVRHARPLRASRTLPFGTI